MRSRSFLFCLSSLASLALLLVVVKSLAPTLLDSLNLSSKSTPVETVPGSIASHHPARTPDPAVKTMSRPARPGSAISSPIEVSERQFDRLTRRGLVLVKFGADWCGPCRRVDLELQQLAQQNSRELTVLKVDIDQEKRLSERFYVGSIPHMILLRDGKRVEQWTGYQSANQLQQAINRAKPPKGTVRGNPFTT